MHINRIVPLFVLNPSCYFYDIMWSHHQSFRSHAELLGRIEFKQDGESGFHNFHPVASLLSYLTKAPLVPDDTPVVNALAKQRAALENIMRACVGLPPENNMMLEFK